MLDLDPYGGTCPLGTFPLFLLRELLMFCPPHLSVVFQRLIRLGSFQAYLRQANVTHILKGPRSSCCQFPTDFHNISIVLDVYASIVGASEDLWNPVVCFQPPSLLFWKGLGTRDALLCVSHTLQSALESGQEVRIIQIDFSAAFNRVNHLAFSISYFLWVLEVLCCLY